MSDHDFDARLLDLLYGELPPDEAKAVQAEVNDDPVARKTLEAWSAVREAVADLPTPEPDPQVHYNILRAARAEVAPAEPSGFFAWLAKFAMSPAFAGAAAVMVLAVGSLVYFNQEDAAPDSALDRAAANEAAAPVTAPALQGEATAPVTAPAPRSDVTRTAGDGDPAVPVGKPDKEKGYRFGLADDADMPGEKAALADEDKRASARGEPKQRNAPAKAEIGQLDAKGGRGKIADRLDEGGSDQPTDQPSAGKDRFATGLDLDAAKTVDKKAPPAPAKAKRPRRKSRAKTEARAVKSKKSVAQNRRRAMTKAVPRKPPATKAPDAKPVTATPIVDASAETKRGTAFAPPPPGREKPAPETIVAEREPAAAAPAAGDETVKDARAENRKRDDALDGVVAKVAEEAERADREQPAPAEAVDAVAAAKTAAVERDADDLAANAAPPPPADSDDDGLLSGEVVEAEEKADAAPLRRVEQTAAPQPRVVRSTMTRTARGGDGRAAGAGMAIGGAAPAPVNAMPDELRQARAARQRGDHRTAVTAYSRYFDRHPRHGEFNRSLFEAAASYEALGNISQAIRVYRLIQPSAGAWYTQAQTRLAALKSVQAAPPKRPAAEAPEAFDAGEDRVEPMPEPPAVDSPVKQ